MVKYEIKVSKEEHDEYIMLKEQFEKKLDEEMVLYHSSHDKDNYVQSIMLISLGIMLSLVIVASLNLVADGMDTGIMFVSYVIVGLLSLTAGYFMRNKKNGII